MLILAATLGTDGSRARTEAGRPVQGMLQQPDYGTSLTGTFTTFPKDTLLGSGQSWESRPGSVHSIAQPADPPPAG